MTEWLDIVDKHDAVIGRATRERIHKEGHYHRSSHIVLFNSRGQVMVQLRSHLKDTNPGLWDASAAGHVDSGESYLQCAARELHEELGIKLSEASLEFIARLEPEERNGFEFTEVFITSSDLPLVLEADEVIDQRWLLPDDLDDWVADQPDAFTDVFRIIWPMVQVHRAANVIKQ